MNLEKAPDKIKALASDKIQNLDVRPILKSGGEPFSQIMNTIEHTPLDGAMRLRATFEPKPLFRVLGAHGWSHWVEFGQEDDWIIWFYREETPNTDEAAIAATNVIGDLKKRLPELETRLVAADGIWTLDVRDLAPPEPMELTLSVIESLPTNTKLRQLNQRVPQFLLPILEERGFSYEIEHTSDTVRIEISRSS